MTLGDAAPPPIADDEVLIRVRAASLNPVDWKLRNGVLREYFEPEFPIVPGRDGSGEIVRLGDAARDLRLAEGQTVSFISSQLRQGSMKGSFLPANCPIKTAIGAISART